MTPEEERRLVADVVDLQVQLAMVSQELIDLSQAHEGRAGARGAARLFATVDDWVDGYFVPVFRRPLGGEFRWCAQWFEHSEARERLEALWRSWEALRVDEPAGMATWLTSLLDPQLPILMGSRGPFHGCTPGRHSLEQALGPTAPDGRTQQTSVADAITPAQPSFAFARPPRL